METQNQSLFVWTMLRVSFWVMIFLWALVSYMPDNTMGLAFQDYVYLISIISTFVLSIIHLVKYDKKAFAITSLVISSIGLLLIIIGFFIGIIQAIALS